MNHTKSLVFASLFTALVIAGTFIKIPVGPVPIVLATLFVLLAGLMLDTIWAAASILLYLGLGAIGLPVFSSGGGIAYFAGPTGGYLIGYLLAALVANLLSSERADSIVRDVVAVICASVVIYAIGVPWLKASLDMSWSAAFSAGLTPFLIGDAIKAAVAASLFIGIKRRYPELMPRSGPAPKPGTADSEG